MGQYACKPCDCKNLCNVTELDLTMAKKFEAKSVPLGEALTTSVTLASPTLNFRSFTKRDTSNVVTLQAVWRGYTVRKQVSFLKKQSKASSKYLTQAEVHETVSKKLSIPRHKQRREPYTYKSAGVYVGEWKGGFREGHGIMIWNDGSRYDGEWSHGRPCGWGRFTHNDGDIYEGNWRNYYLNPEETIRIQAASNRKDKYSDGYLWLWGKEQNLSGEFDRSLKVLSNLDFSPKRRSTARSSKNTAMPEPEIQRSIKVETKNTQSKSILKPIRIPEEPSQNSITGEQNPVVPSVIKKQVREDSKTTIPIHTVKHSISSDITFPEFDVKPLISDIHSKLHNIKSTLDQARGLIDNMANPTDQVETGQRQFLQHKDENGNIYIGEWLNGKRDGRGRQTWKNGDVYEGEWKEDKQNGLGRSTFSSGCRYIGWISQNCKHGIGEYIWSDGSSYLGQWKNNLMHGVGNYKWACERAYLGYWDKNEINGFGVYNWEDGRRYEGYHEANKRHGEGLYYMADGTVSLNKWRRGKIVNKKR